MDETFRAPDPDEGREPRPRGFFGRRWWVAGLVLAGVVAALAAVFASGDPDGLDSVALQQGFEGKGTAPGLSVIPDYSFPGLDGTLATVAAGLVGIAIVFALTLLVGRLLARRRKDRAG